MGYTMISLQVMDEEKDLLHKVAKRRGPSLSAFLKESSLLVAEMSDWFVKRLDEKAAEMKVSKPLVLENLCIARMAELEAELQVVGGSVLEEFFFESTGPITG